MVASFDKAFGIHAKAMQVHAKRAELLSSNIVNVDTPNYKARDIDFKSALSAASASQQNGQLSLSRTNHQHLNVNGVEKENNSTEVLYRNPVSPSLDGNTVESFREKAEFAENNIRYQVSLSFMTSRIEGMLRSIKGE